MGKLNKTEIVAIARKIMMEVNEKNLQYNEKVKSDPAYIAEIQRLENLDPTVKLTEDFEKQLKIQFGAKYEKHVNFTLALAWKNPLKDEIKDKINEFNKTQLKLAVNKDHVKYLGTSNNYGLTSDFINQFEFVKDELTIGQIDISDIQTLINSIKAKLI